MKIDSSNHLYGVIAVCSKCVKKAKKLTENKTREELFRTGHWVEAECDVCHKITAVKHVKYYDYPIFEVN